MKMAEIGSFNMAFCIYTLELCYNNVMWLSTFVISE